MRKIMRIFVFLLCFNSITASKILNNKGIKSEIITYNFLVENMMSENGGIYTNYKGTKRIKSYATGHEVLSESVGLLMLYALNREMKEVFDQQFNYYKKNMVNEVGLIKWRIKDDKAEIGNTSATIDDLRIIRALVEGYEKWQDDKYLREAYRLCEKMKKYNIYNDSLNNYYNPRSRDRGKEVDLAYLDLYTFQMFIKYGSEGEINKDYTFNKIVKSWIKVYYSALDTIDQGFVSEEFPFYYKEYNIKNKTIIKKREINMIDTLLVVLHLAEVNRVDERSIEWLRESLRKRGKINNNYNSSKGTPTTRDESTAVYAIICRIAKVIGDEKLHEMAIKRMMEFQVINNSSVIYGAFGEESTNTVYSFDILQSLLSF